MVLLLLLLLLADGGESDGSGGGNGRVVVVVAQRWWWWWWWWWRSDRMCDVKRDKKPVGSLLTPWQQAKRVLTHTHSLTHSLLRRSLLTAPLLRRLRTLNACCRALTHHPVLLRDLLRAQHHARA